MTAEQICFLRELLVAGQGLHQRTRIARDRWVEVGRWRGATAATERAFVAAGVTEVVTETMQGSALRRSGATLTSAQ